MTNHPNRGKRTAASNPKPEEIKAAREAAKMTQTEAARVVYATLSAWARWEGGQRRMHPAVWELWRQKVAGSRY